jgi:glycosyltransferase involved in cell wall biosynthesis
MPKSKSRPADTPIRIMRIITRLNVGGPAKHVAWLIKGLDPGKFDQTLVFGQTEDQEDSLLDKLDLPPERLTQLPGMRRSISPIRDLFCIFKLLGLMIRLRPHLVATHTAKAGLLGRTAMLLYRPLSFFTGAPNPEAVHTFHGHVFNNYFSPAREKLILILERFLARFATSRIIAISQRQLGEIRDDYKVAKADKFNLVPLGVDLGILSRDPQAGEAFRAEIGVLENETLIGAVGRIAPIKNYPLFIQAVAVLKKQCPDLYAKCRFVIIGGGNPEELAELEQGIEEHGIKERFWLLGNRSDPQGFFKGLDLLCLTSKNEGTPLAIIEGGSSGLPVVATKVGGVADLLGQSQEELSDTLTLRQRGLTTPSEDSTAMAQGIAWMLDNPGQARLLGRHLQEYVWRSHSLQRLFDDLGRLYSETCQ